MTLAEKRKIKAEEKKLEKEEARAKFRLNQIKPTTNACFNIPQLQVYVQPAAAVLLPEAALPRAV